MEDLNLLTGQELHVCLVPEMGAWVADSNNKADGWLLHKSMSCIVHRISDLRLPLPAQIVAYIKGSPPLKHKPTIQVRSIPFAFILSGYEGKRKLNLF